MRQPVPFGKYLLLDRISVGGMAEVFKAKSYGVEGFEKIIAIKRILPSMGEDKDFIRMFIDEAKIAGQLSHPNIGQIFELGRAHEAHYIAMEYIWGKDLLQIQNRCRKRGEVMPIGMACFIIAKAAEGLDYAHKKRDPLGKPMEIVHRDCSPQNVLISYEGEVKIIDFGIAKAASRSSRTNAGVLKGKFGYMSPEQVRGLPLDQRSDIFALGTILYECLTGDRLFQGESDFSTLEKVRNAEVTPIGQLRDDIPAEVEAIVMRALARDPRQRYQWCSELHADLIGYLTRQPSVFTAKNLGEWLRHWFHDDLEREQQQLEAFRLMDGGFDGAPPADLDIEAAFGPAGVAEGEPTVLAPPSFDAIDEPTGAREGSEPEVEILVDGTTPPPVLGAAVVDESTTAAIPAPGWPSAAGAYGPGVHSGPIKMPPDPPAFVPATTDVGLRRSGRGREIFIALGFAAMVLGGIAVAFLLFFDRTERPDPVALTGTIAVVGVDGPPADVALDGRSVGTTRDRQPLTIEGLAPRTYTLSVSRAGSPPCERKVSVVARRVELVGCPLEPARPGRLVLGGLRANDVVFVDDRALSAAAGREPIELTAGARHRIAVRRDGAEVESFDLELAAGQEVERTIGTGGKGADRAIERAAEKPDAPRPPASPRPREGRAREDGAEPGAPETAPDRDEPGPPRAGVTPAAPSPPRPAPSGTGRFTAFTRPFARVFIDGRDTGKMTPITPRSAIELPVGVHKITFVVDDRRYNYEVLIEDGETRNLVKELPATQP